MATDTKRRRALRDAPRALPAHASATRPHEALVGQVYGPSRVAAATLGLA